MNADIWPETTDRLLTIPDGKRIAFAAWDWAPSWSPPYGRRSVWWEGHGGLVSDRASLMTARTVPGLRSLPRQSGIVVLIRVVVLIQISWSASSLWSKMHIARVMNADGSGQTRLTDNAAAIASDSGPDWSPK